MTKVKIKSHFSMMEILGAQEMLRRIHGRFEAPPELYTCQGSLYCAEGFLIEDKHCWNLKCCEISESNILFAYCVRNKKTKGGEVEVFKYFIIGDGFQVQPMPQNWELVR